MTSGHKPCFLCEVHFDIKYDMALYLMESMELVHFVGPDLLWCHALDWDICHLGLTHQVGIDLKEDEDGKMTLLLGLLALADILMAVMLKFFCSWLIPCRLTPHSLQGRRLEASLTPCCIQVYQPPEQAGD
jgi:hypothetical protein